MIFHFKSGIMYICYFTPKVSTDSVDLKLIKFGGLL